MIETVIGGTEADFEKVFNACKPLVYATARRTLQRSPCFGYLKDDLVSAGYLGLTEGLRQLQKTEDKGKANEVYLTKVIHNLIVEAIRDEQTINAPPGEFTREYVDVDTLLDGVEDTRLYDKLWTSLRTDRERQLIKLRCQGFNRSKISKKLRISIRTLDFTMRKIKGRLK